MSGRTIVCDNGTGYCKVGYAGSNFPELIFPSMIGVPMMRFEEEFKDVELKSVMCGDVRKEIYKSKSHDHIFRLFPNGFSFHWDT